MSPAGEDLDGVGTTVSRAFAKLALSSAGVGALLYVLGFVAVRAKLNMLGVVSASASLRSEIYIQEFIRFVVAVPLFSVLALAVLVVILGPIALALRHFGLTDLSVALRRPVTARHAALTGAGFAAVILRIATSLDVKQGLLLGCDGYLGTLPGSHQAYILFGLQLCALIPLLGFVVRLFVHFGSSLVTPVLLGAHVLLLVAAVSQLMIGYGTMIASNIYEVVTLTSDGKSETTGYLLLETDREYVIAVPPTPEHSDAREIVTVGRTSGQVLKVRHQPVRADGQLPDLVKEVCGARSQGPTPWSLPLLALLVFAVAGTALAGSPQGLPDGGHRAVETETEWLVRFFPPVLGAAEVVFQAIDAVVRSVRGDDDEVPSSAAKLNVWLFSFESRALRPLTVDGGYTYPRVSSDSRSLAVLRNGQIWLVRLDREERKRVSESQFVGLLAWDTVRGELLAVDSNGEPWIVALDGNQRRARTAKPQRAVSVSELLQLSRTNRQRAQLFDAKGVGSNGRAILVDRGAAEAETVIEDAFGNWMPSWLPDREEFVFVSDRPVARPVTDGKAPLPEPEKALR